MFSSQENINYIPTEDDLRKLPLRALVAYAARCARRVQSIFILPSSNHNFERDAVAVANAILSAEEYARGKDVNCMEAYAAATAAATSAQSAKDVPTGFQALNAANSAAEAAYSVYAAASDLSSNNAIATKAFMIASEKLNLEKALTIVRAEATVNFAARSSAFAANATQSSIALIRTDYNNLLKLSLGTLPDMGILIDPSEDGPLGVLWPNGTPKWYAVDQNHPFYEEILQFFVSTISLSTLMWASIVDKQFSQDKTPIVETQNGNPRMVVLPDLRIESHIIELECKEECIFSPASTIDYLIGNTERPYQLFFALRPLLWIFPNESDIHGEVQRHIGPSLETIACYLVGGAFERYKDYFRQKYGRDINWPPQLQFFKHLRNGCFHNNIFNIQKRRNGSNQIDPVNPPLWHIYTMASDTTITGKKVIDGFFRLPHFLPFLYDMGKWV